MGGNGSREVKIKMEADNALVTFPGLKESLDDQDQRLDHLLELLKYAANKAMDQVPGGLWLDLIKDAINYIIGMSTDRDDSFKEAISKYHLNKINQEYSEEMCEIKFRLSKVKESGRCDTDNKQSLDYCLGRCGVLLKKFGNNVDNALVLTVLFSELVFVYIAIGSAIVNLKRDQRTANEMSERFNQIQTTIVEFKKKAIQQRIAHVRCYKDPYSADWGYEDELRPDMKGIHIVGEFMTPSMERMLRTQEKRVDEYKTKLETMYSEYFDLLKQVLDEAIDVL